MHNSAADLGDASHGRFLASRQVASVIIVGAETKIAVMPRIVGSSRNAAAALF
jgi:hypothetical protein